MSEFTAKEYEIAAKVARASDDPYVLELANQWINESERITGRNNYAADIGKVFFEFRSEPWDALGWRVMNKLMEDGWTPPRGLL